MMRLTQPTHAMVMQKNLYELIMSFVRYSVRLDIHLPMKLQTAHSIPPRVCVHIAVHRLHHVLVHPVLSTRNAYSWKALQLICGLS